MGKWFQKMLAVLPFMGGIVQAIEYMHTEAKSGADKRTLALQALGLAGSVAQAADPAEAAEITSVQQLAGSTIDGLVDVFNKNGWAHKPAKGAPQNAPGK